MKEDKTPVSDLVKEMVKEMDANEFYNCVDLQDEIVQEPLFQIDLNLSGGASPETLASLRKPWSEFQRLHYLLLTDEFGCNEEVKGQLPDLPTPPGTDCSPSSVPVDELAQSLQEYFNQLLKMPTMMQSNVFSGFLDEQSRWGWGSPGVEDQDAGGKGSLKEDSEHDSGPKPNGKSTSAIDFLVQPFDYSKTYIPRRTSHRVDIDVLRGESVVWKFIVADHMDIEFSVNFRAHPVGPPLLLLRPPPSDGVEAGPAGGAGHAGGSSAAVEDGAASEEANVAPSASQEEDSDGDSMQETVHQPTRYCTGNAAHPVRGSFTCPTDGTCSLLWNNSYSRLRGKRLSFVVESVTSDTMRAAIEAADAVARKSEALPWSSPMAEVMALNRGGLGQGQASVSIRPIDSDVTETVVSGDGGGWEGEGQGGRGTTSG
ncbi:unnamed protein product, partial [Discosporangium mesarthrocarpum]